MATRGEMQPSYPQSFEKFLEEVQIIGNIINCWVHFSEMQLKELMSGTPGGYKKFKIRAHTLTLHGNNLQDYGATVFASLLKDNKHLKILELNSNKIATEGAKSIADALKKNTRLQKLSLQNNKLNDEAINCLVDAFHDHKSLRHVSLKGNPYGDLGQGLLKALVEAKDGLTVIDNDNKPILSDRELRLNRTNPEALGELDTEVGKILDANHLAKYARKFFIKNINTLEQAMALSSEELTKIGVTDIQDRVTIEKILRPSATLSSSRLANVREAFKKGPSSKDRSYMSKPKLSD